MENMLTDYETDNALIKMLEKKRRASTKSEQKMKLRKSKEYQDELKALRRIIHDFSQSLRICTLVASRWEAFTNNYLLPRHFNDIVESVLTAQLAIESGILGPARRELRYILELVVNTAYVDEVKARSSLDERIGYLASQHVNKSNVDHIFDIPLRMLGIYKESFADSVREAWARASYHADLQKRSIDEQLNLPEDEIPIGLESLEMLEQVVSEVHEVCSIVMALAFETIGPSFTADILVDTLETQDHWSFHSSEYIAAIDAYFDCKQERKERLDRLCQRRNERIKYSQNPYFT